MKSVNYNNKVVIVVLKIKTKSYYNYPAGYFTGQISK